MNQVTFAVALAWAVGSAGTNVSLADDGLAMHLRHREETRPGSGVYRPIFHSEHWNASETAIIVCDMWDAHHCYNATQRVKELAPRIGAVLERARTLGMFIIHAPSSCTGAYEGTAARQRAIDAPLAADLPDGINAWRDDIPAEKDAVYPLDQSDGGEDDDPVDHARWHDYLKKIGRNPKQPWQRQIAILKIDERDAVTDDGVEVWNLLSERGIRNVILVGVHTNMCVLGRPFGLRQLAANGKHVVLMRDLTDTMYNPARAPFVSHFTGTDRIVKYIEKYVCPTILSTDIQGDEPFRFRADNRPRVAVVVSEFEYDTCRTLPQFAKARLGKDFKVDYLLNDDRGCHDIPGLELLDEADLLILSIWRRALPKEQLDRIRRFVASGKPIVAIRTSSHAFATRDGVAPPGHALWLEFDREVLGGSYNGHYGNRASRGRPPTTLAVADGAADHAILNGVSLDGAGSASWLYKMRPLSDAAVPILIGRAGGTLPPETVAWVHTTSAGGKVFYTSLGHQDDFRHRPFQQMLENAVYWAGDVPSSSSTKGVATAGPN